MLNIFHVLVCQLAVLPGEMSHVFCLFIIKFFAFLNVEFHIF